MGSLPHRLAKGSAKLPESFEARIPTEISGGGQAGHVFLVSFSAKDLSCLPPGEFSFSFVVATLKANTEAG